MSKFVITIDVPAEGNIRNVTPLITRSIIPSINDGNYRGMFFDKNGKTIKWELFQNSSK